MTEALAPTPEQEAIRSRVSAPGHIMIDALAGTGKTTTIKLLESSLAKPLLYIVFNKRNKEEAEDKFADTTVVRTWNGFGDRIWKGTVANVSLNAKKVADLLREMIREAPKSAQGEMWDVYWDVIHGVGMAKSVGYIPDGVYPNAKRLTTRGDFHALLEERPDDFIADLIDAVLIRSIKAAYAGAIDFNDQVYMPALFGGTFPRFPNVAIDEFQDSNPVNLEMLRKLARHSRIIGVGDPAQSIYAFRGANPQAMEQAVAEHGMTRCDLSVSFRCPEAVVKAAQWRVPHFKWSKAGGRVETLRRMEAGDIPDTATIICRNNAPLLGTAFKLLSSGRSVSVAGSDIGPKLVGLMRKLGPETSSRDTVLGLIEDWRAEKIDKGSTTADDMADCMKVFASHGDSLGQAISYAEHIFAQKGSIKLMTGHKSKGLEFDTVYLLDPFLLRDDEQDRNLRYVMQTRSKDRLFEINSRDIQWPRD